MAEEKQGATWPIPKFLFKVMLDDLPEILFQEVSGLSQAGEIEYRAGNSAVFNVAKMPGTNKNPNITLKKGISKNERTFHDLSARRHMTPAPKGTMVIHLLDEAGETLMTWTLKNAVVVKITSVSLANENEVGIETLEIFHEGLSIANT